MALDLSTYYLLERIIDAKEDGELPEGFSSLPELIDDLHDMIDENGGGSRAAGWISGTLRVRSLTRRSGRSSSGIMVTTRRRVFLG